MADWQRRSPHANDSNRHCIPRPRSHHGRLREALDSYDPTVVAIYTKTGGPNFGNGVTNGVTASSVAWSLGDLAAFGGTESAVVFVVD